MMAAGEYYYRAFGQSQDTTLAVLPMFHIFGLGVTMSGRTLAPNTCEVR